MRTDPVNTVRIFRTMPPSARWGQNTAYFLSTWPPFEQYVPAALSIALLVLLAALGFKHYVGVQAQSRDRFMWSGIGAVALAFSLFLSLLFVFKIADWYSRGTFFFQFIGAATAILITRGAIHA